MLLKKIEDVDDLQKTFETDNAEENKRHQFNLVLPSLLLSYVIDNLDFWNVSTGSQKEFVFGLLYKNYKRKWERGEINREVQKYYRGEIDFSQDRAAHPDWTLR